MTRSASNAAAAFSTSSTYVLRTRIALLELLFGERLESAPEPRIHIEWLLIIWIKPAIDPERRPDSLAVRQHRGHVGETHAALHVAVGIGRQMKPAVALDWPSRYSGGGGSLPVSIHWTRLRSTALNTGRKLTGFCPGHPIVASEFKSGGMWATPASS